MKRQDVLSRIYREDAKADEDWTAIANKVPLDRPVPPHEATTRESLEREYLQTVLTPLQFYSVEVDIERQDEAGGLVKSTDNRYFQVLGAQTSQTRERTMHTVRSADDVTQQNGMLVQILWMDRWYAADHDDAVRVYAVDDPEWVHPQEIADFDNLQHRMTLYRQSVADNDHPACMIVSDPVVARPKYPLDDARAPTLAVAWYLRQHGGVPVNAICDHKEAWVAENPWNFDHRGGTRCKPYLQVLLKLAQCLPLSGGHVPSQQPMTYYRLLMRGIKTEPGLKHKHYALVHNRALKKEEGDILPLEDDDPPDDPNEFFAVPVGAHAKEPPRRRAGGLGHGRGGPRPKPLPAPPIVDGPHDEPVPVEDNEYFADPPAPEVEREKKPRTDYGGYHPAIDGCKVSYQPCGMSHGTRLWNWRLKCPEHGGCYKSIRDVDRHQARFGNIEPLAFLHAWAKVPWPTSPEMGTHAQETPSDDQVRDFALAHSGELQELYEKWAVKT